MKFNLPTARYTAALLVVLSINACSSGSGNVSNGQLSVIITDPDVAEIETIDATIVLRGTASSESGIAAVSWQSDQSANGTASGGERWETDAIPLSVGANSITVTATDTAGATTTDTIRVTRSSGQANGSATLSWTAPTQRSDGSALTDLSGYRIHYGRMSGIYDDRIVLDNPGLVSYVVDGLSAGTWYFAIKAVDSAGVESDFSNEALKAIP